MKKIICFVLMAVFTCNAHAFWIWSPKSKKIKHAKQAASTLPTLQYAQAYMQYEAKQYQRAIKGFKKLLKKYPDAQEAADSQFYLAQAYLAIKKSVEAFDAYQKLVESYPNSKHINEAIDQQFSIADSFVREPKKMLGMSKYDFTDHPSIEMFRKIVEKSTYSPQAPIAQYKLGVVFNYLSKYDEARQEFQKVVDMFPESEWAAPARYQLALATVKSFGGVDYDSTNLEDAAKRLAEFVRLHPQAEVAPQAEQKLDHMIRQEAQKDFETAQFYERLQKYTSARGYYQRVIELYGDSEYADKAKECLKKLKGIDE